MKNFKITLLICFSLLPFITKAGDIFFYAKNNEFSQGEEFTIIVKLDTKGDVVNAVEGDIVIPIDIFKIKDITDGGSVINFWIEKPSIFKDNTIHFAGITPGGFFGNDNILFKIVLIGKKSGESQIFVNNVRTLKNDGLASEIVTTQIPFSISITDKIFDFFSFGNIEEDKELPESFTPFVASDPNIFGGKYFLNFVTQDKISGIDHYEVREGDWGVSNKAESPYLLTNQNLNVKIYIKAIDKKGNIRIEVIAPKNPTQVKSNSYINLILLISVLFILFITFRKKFIKTLKK